MKQDFESWLKTAKIKANHCELVSLDVFDTCLLRRVSAPKDLFLLVEKAKSLEGFADSRIKAEKSIRLQRAEAGFEEITLEEIYSELELLKPEWKRDLPTLLETELDFEFHSSLPHPWIYTFYQWCVHNGISIAFISDVYLPDSFVAKLLAHAGYHVDNNLWVSSRWLKTKHTGTLFDLVRDQLKLKSKKWLHVGDNEKADVLSAKSKHLKTHPIFRINIDSKPSPTVESALFKGIQANQLFNIAYPNTADFFYRLGQSTTGPLVTLWSQWLMDEWQSYQPDVVLFFSREGALVKDTLETLYPNSEIPFKYCLTSRRAAGFAAIHELDDDALDFLVAGADGFRVRNFFERIGLGTEAYVSLLPTGSIRTPDQYFKKENLPDLKSLFALCKDEILEKASVERNAYLGYLKSIIPQGAKKIALVDIGWNGSIQKSFAKIFNKAHFKVDLQGYYLGTFSSALEFQTASNRSKGFIVNNSNPKNRYLTLLACLEVVEILFSSNEKSLEKFTRSPSNNLEPKYLDKPTESLSDAEISSLHKGVHDFLTYWKICIHTSKTEIENASDSAFACLHRLLISPTEDELTVLGSIYFTVGFGESKNCRQLFTTRSNLYYFFHPSDLYQDFKSVHWKVLFWKKIHPILRLYLRILSPQGSKKVLKQL